MIRITVDEAQKQQLLNSNGVVELCDESGRVIAQATPLPRAIADPWSLFPELTPEEIERRCNSGEPGLTTEQVKEYLRQRERPA